MNKSIAICLVPWKVLRKEEKVKENDFLIFDCSMENN